MTLGREAVGEEVAETHMALVEQLRVSAVQALNPTREVDSPGVNDDVIVRRHQAEGMDDPAIALD